jgi:ATP-dependent RNA helicase RhlE
MDFDTFGLHPAIAAGIQELGYDKPTPIQAQSIPSILAGRDLIGLAQTGTGKTAAFALPILHRLMSSPRGRVGAAVISPTRELAEQTCSAFNELGYLTGLRSTAIYGGVGMDQQLRELRDGAEIVVGCPGRMLDHLWRGTLDFTQLQILVIDEADRMFDMGFLPSLRDILQCILQPRQTLLFSATMPEDIRLLVQDVLHDPVTVQVGRILPAKMVSHVLYPVSEQLKPRLLESLLRRTETKSVLVFTRTKYRADRVARHLKAAGFDVTSLQGDMTQPQRQAAISGFRSGRFKVMVATDIAARGIDILSISHVINYDMPDDTDSYIHRIGRTGRVNQEGEALTLVTNRDAAVVSDLERLLNVKLERRMLSGFNYRPLARDSGSVPPSSTNSRRRVMVPLKRFASAQT